MGLTNSRVKTGRSTHRFLPTTAVSLGRVLWLAGLIFNFLGRLATLLTGTKGTAEITYRFRGNPTSKDSVEALGIPHTEIDLLLIAGRSVVVSGQPQCSSMQVQWLSLSGWP